MRTTSAKAAWAGAASLLPYIAMKTYWAFGGTAGKPAGDLVAQLRDNGAPDALVWMERHGLDFTVVAAFGGMVLLAALASSRGPRLLVVPGWAGALLLTPYGIGTMVAAPLGFSVGDAEGWSPWVGVVGGLGFAGLGVALGVCVLQRRVRLTRMGERSGSPAGSGAA